MNYFIVNQYLGLNIKTRRSKSEPRGHENLFPSSETMTISCANECSQISPRFGQSGKINYMLLTAGRELTKTAQAFDFTHSGRKKHPPAIIWNLARLPFLPDSEFRLLNLFFCQVCLAVSQGQKCEKKICIGSWLQYRIFRILSIVRWKISLFESAGRSLLSRTYQNSIFTSLLALW